MSSPHFDIKILSRSQGHSALKAAAYCAGERFYNARAKEIHDWAWREDVAHSEILAPEGTPKFLLNRETLWNKVEESETRKDAQLARYIILGLPHEINHEERVTLLRSFVEKNFVAQGMIADIAMHKPDLKKGAHHLNHHAHILLTLRQADEKGFYRTKTRSWNAKDLTNKWRAAWADEQNLAFARNGLAHQVDRRTLAPKPKLEHSVTFPKQYQVKVEPEIKLGKRNHPDYLKRLRENDRILAGNISKVATLRRKYEKKQQRLDKLKDRHMRRIAQLRNFPGADHLLRDRLYKDKRRLYHVEQRMRFVVRMSDLVFQLLIYLYGLETVLRHRREILKERSKNWQKIHQVQDKINAVNRSDQIRAQERNRQRERERSLRRPK